MPGRVWTKQEDDFFIKNADKMTRAELAKHFSRTSNAVSIRAGILGIKIVHEQKQRQRESFSANQIKYLKRNAGKVDIMEMAQKLNTSTFAIEEQLKKYGLDNEKVVEQKKQAPIYIDPKIDDYKKLLGQQKYVKKVLEEKGKIGPYRLVSALKDKAVVLNKKGYKECLTYAEIVMNIRKDK